MGFKDHPVRAKIGRRGPFHQLIRPSAPRARSVENSPLLLPPATEFPVKLPVADVQPGEPDQRPPIWFRKHEPDRIRIEDVQAGPWLEVHNLASHERLF